MESWNGVWLSLVERSVRDAEVVGSNPITPMEDPGASLGLFVCSSVLVARTLPGPEHPPAADDGARGTAGHPLWDSSPPQARGFALESFRIPPLLGGRRVAVHSGAGLRLHFGILAHGCPFPGFARQRQGPPIWPDLARFVGSESGLKGGAPPTRPSFSNASVRSSKNRAQ